VRWGTQWRRANVRWIHKDISTLAPGLKPWGNMPHFSAHEKIDVISSCWALTICESGKHGLNQRQYDNTPLRELMKLTSI